MAALPQALAACWWLRLASSRERGAIRRRDGLLPAVEFDARALHALRRIRRYREGHGQAQFICGRAYIGHNNRRAERGGRPIDFIAHRQCRRRLEISSRSAGMASR